MTGRIEHVEVEQDLFKLGFEQASGPLANLITTSADGRRVAVFDFDNTCIINDIGEIFSYHLVDRMLYRYDLDAFWDLIDPRDGRDTLREMVNILLQAPEDQRTTHALFESYQSEMNAIYTRRLLREGKADCYAWAVTLHVGIHEEDMMQWSREAIEDELQRPLHTQTLITERGEQWKVSRGIRRIHAIERLMRWLEQGGIEVWICSATNLWTVREFAAHFGIPRHRVIGNLVETDGQTLTSTLVEPALFREGKRVAIEREIGVEPVLVVGDSETDYGMLEIARELALFLDTGDNQKYSDYAKSRGWTVISRSNLLLK